MNFGEKLRQLRNEKGPTQPELADAMGIEQSYLSKLENAGFWCPRCYSRSGLAFFTLAIRVFSSPTSFTNINHTALCSKAKPWCLYV